MKLTLTSDTGEVLQEWENSHVNWPLFNTMQGFATGIARQALDIEVRHNFLKWEKTSEVNRERPKLLLSTE